MIVIIKNQVIFFNPATGRDNYFELKQNKIIDIESFNEKVYFVGTKPCVINQKLFDYSNARDMD